MLESEFGEEEPLPYEEEEDSKRIEEVIEDQESSIEKSRVESGEHDI